MTKHEINEKIRQAFDHATPDVWDAVLSDCKAQKGRVYVMTDAKKRKTWVTRVATIAACLCLLIGAGIGFQNYQVNHTVDTTVSLDVNPSIEIQVNQKERVLDVIPLNDDGKIIVGDMDFSGSNLDVTVHAIIGSMLQNGYLNELTNSILISVDNNDPARGAALQERLTAEVNRLLQTDTFSGSVLSQTVAKNDDLQQLAEKYGITMGKAQLIQAILVENPLHTFEDLVPLSINELNLLLSTKPVSATQVEVVGTASDRAYIGETKAKEIALEKAGVTASSLIAYEIELDTDNGIMVYDIEFTSSDYEYDCEIDAVTGTVVKFEKEYIGVPAASSPTSSPASNATQGHNTQPVSQPTTQITPEKAKEIALNHAGVKASDVTGYKSELDWDDGVKVYELEFWAGDYEYDYEINAVTGTVLKSEKEYHGSTVNPSPTQSNTTPQSSTAQPASQITAARAKEIALNHAGVKSSDVSGFKSELDWDDGVSIYELEFNAGGYEYDYEINAATGAVVKSEKDRDD
ncbi:MAG: PepSY domain-containing protein [Firmicutes bacterium]|nr:PepSY domain-containing protein [Candidatus Fermentithermobacillaceae bacterium]